jgi:hypothetical protein
MENPILSTSEESSYEVPYRFDKDPYIPYLEISFLYGNICDNKKPYHK